MQAAIQVTIAAMAHRSQRRRSLIAMCLLALVALAALVLDAAPPARADTATGPSTSGTASTVSPSTVAVGGTLMYTVSGFPRGATVQILIDDGALATSPDHAAVVATISIDEDGTASGSFELPEYVGLGSHWLRFRVSAGQDVATSTVRTADYTNKSPYFTVAGVTVIGGTQAVPTPTPEPDPTPPPLAAGQGSPGGGGPDAGSPLHRSAVSETFPMVGASILALSGVLVLLSVIVVVNRRRLATMHKSDAEERRAALPHGGLHA